MILLNKILEDVFGYKEGECVVILYDQADTGKNKDWIFRINLAKSWFQELKKINIPAELAGYHPTFANNADLPNACFVEGVEKQFEEILSKADIVIALTEFSATAPLSKYAKKLGFRGASMPGFNESMIPSLEIDYGDVAKKVDKIYARFACAEAIIVTFGVDKKEYTLSVDLKSRLPIKDDGDCTKSKTIINLPSGECFIAPNDSNKSKTEGYLPIQIGNKVEIFIVEKNKIVDCLSDSGLMKRIKEDPAVGNIAEVAFGVLGLFGLKPSGKVLLDEKLGPHIALGRSDHFGGLTGPSSFKKKENVWHQDYVYIKEMQPLIKIKEMKIGTNLIIKNGKYAIF